MLSIPFKKKTLTAFIGTALASYMPFTFADDNAGEKEEVERLEIVGSHIKRSDLEGASPVQTISRDQIELSGANTVQQLLFNLPSNGAGSFNSASNSQDETSIGSAGISFRGLGADSTLILINGRRATVSPFADSISTAFVDLNTIPMAAIERIEILKDGASAVYGSDAIAGVINVVLRRDFEGIDFNLTFGDTSQSTNESEENYSIVWGMGNERSHATVMFEYFNRNTQMLIDRDFSASADQSANPEGDDARSSAPEFINYQDPVTDIFIPDENCPADRLTDLGDSGAICRFDYAPFITALPGAERTGLMVTGDHEFTPTFSAFLEVASQHNTGSVSGAPSPAFDLFTYSLTEGKPFDLPVTKFRRRFVEAGPRVYNFTNDSFRVLAGLRGDLTDTWEWEAAYVSSRSETNQISVSGFVRTDLIQDALDDGSFDPFGGPNPAQQDAVDAFTTQVQRFGESRTKTFDFKMTGQVVEIAAGSIDMAVGLEYREEFVVDIPDQQFAEGVIVGTENTAASGERDLVSAYTEFFVPVAERLDMQFAFRYEDYSDFGTTTNPKVSARFRPSDNITMRASWGTGFRAPSLAQLGLGATNESPELIDVVRCPLTGDALDCGATEYVTTVAGNPNLIPEESESYNLGLVYEYDNDLNFGVDYWNYTFENLIDKRTQDLLALEAAGLLPAGVIIRDTPTAADIAVGAPGRIVDIFDTFLNLGFQETDGVDFDVNFKTPLMDGNLGLSFTWTHILSFDEQATPDGLTEDLNGQYQRPENRWNLAATWEMEDWTIAALSNFIGEYKDDQDLGKTRTVDSWLTFDTNVRYLGWQDMVVTLGVVNLLDEEPPYSASEFQGYDYQTHNARGRFIYASYSYHFE